MTVTIEVPATISFDDLNAVFAPIRTLSVRHSSTDSLHLKVELSTIYPEDIFEAGKLIGFLFVGEFCREQLK